MCGRRPFFELDMREVNQQLTAEMVQLLDRIESVDIEECRADYNYFQDTFRGWEMDEFHDWGKKFGSTRRIVEILWRNWVDATHGAATKDAELKAKFIKAIEFAVREERIKAA